MPRLPSLLLALSLALLGACGGGGSSSGGGTSTGAQLSFSGTVTDASGNPVSGAALFLKVYNQDGSSVTWSGGSAMVTDGQGRFSFTFDPANLGAQADSYTVGVQALAARFLREAWYQATSGSTPDEAQATRLPAASPGSLSGIALVMEAGGALNVSVDGPGYVDFLGDSHAWSKRLDSAGSVTAILPADGYVVRFRPDRGDRLWWAGTGQNFDPAQAQAIAVQLGQQAAPSPVFQAGYLPDKQVPGLVLQRVNHYRRWAGRADLTASSILDQAAQNHAHYLVQNNLGYSQGLSLHDEDPSLQGFTGADAKARVDAAAQAAGVPSPTTWSPAEDIAPGKGPVEAVDSLVHTVYHQVPLLHADTLHLGAGRDRSADGSLEYTVVLAGVSKTPSTTGLYTYPADGQTGLPTDFTGEIPNPLDNSGLSFPVGAPIGLYAPGHQLTVNAADLTDDQGGTVGLLILDQNSDPHGLLKDDNAFLVPHQTLEPFTTYTVTVQYALDGGPPQSLSFSFTTGAAGPP